MKHIHKVKFLTILLAIGMTAHAQKFHDFSLVDQDTNTITLRTLQGKKIMIIIFGGDNMDKAFIKKFISFVERYKDTIKVIAVLSFDDGYQGKDLTLLLKGNRDALSSVIFTEGYFTRKTKKQSPLIKWLTTKEQNKHFADDVKGIGHKFFVDETGEMYADIGPEIPLDSKMINRVVHRN